MLEVDECQRWFEHPSYGSELQAISEDLVQRGPALGIIPIFATQRPDAKSLPTAISANAVLRFCLKVMGQVENDMVLGTSAYKNGVRATMFARSDRGIGYLAGEGDDPQIVRSFYLDAPAAEPSSPGPAGCGSTPAPSPATPWGRTPSPPTAAGSLLADILAVVPADQAKVWNQTVVARLAELRPDRYGGWEPEQLTAALKPHGVSAGQVWGTDPVTGEARESPRHHPRPGHRGRRADPPPAPRPRARMTRRARGLRLAPTPLGLATPLAPDPPADQPPNP